MSRSPERSEGEMWICYQTEFKKRSRRGEDLLKIQQDRNFFELQLLHYLIV